MTDEEKRILDTPIEAKTGEKRKIEAIIGRQKLKKSFTYEIKWQNLDHKVRGSQFSRPRVILSCI